MAVSLSSGALSFSSDLISYLPPWTNPGEASELHGGGCRPGHPSSQDSHHLRLSSSEPSSSVISVEGDESGLLYYCFLSLEYIKLLMTPWFQKAGWTLYLKTGKGGTSDAKWSTNLVSSSPSLMWVPIANTWAFDSL